MAAAPLPLGAIVAACSVVGNFTFSPLQAEAGEFVELGRKSPLSKGKHTVKLARSGPLPHLVALRLDEERQRREQTAHKEPGSKS